MVLDQLLAKFKIENLSEDEKKHLNYVWHRLKPWPDSVQGLTRLKKKFVIAPLSNGNVSLLTNMAKQAGLPWDAILSTEIVKRYKPDRETYLMAAEFWDVEPAAVMMVAAHAGDLDAAKKLGLKTAYVHRPLEFGPARTPNPARPTAATTSWPATSASSRRSWEPRRAAKQQRLRPCRAEEPVLIRGEASASERAGGGAPARVKKVDRCRRKDPRVDAYIAKAADFAKPILKEIRTRVHEACPGVRRDDEVEHAGVRLQGRDVRHGGVQGALHVWLLEGAARRRRQQPARSIPASHVACRPPVEEGNGGADSQGDGAQRRWRRRRAGRHARRRHRPACRPTSPARWQKNKKARTAFDCLQPEPQARIRRVDHGSEARRNAPEASPDGRSSGSRKGSRETGSTSESAAVRRFDVDVSTRNDATTTRCPVARRRIDGHGSLVS